MTKRKTKQRKSKLKSHLGHRKTTQLELLDVVLSKKQLAILLTTGLQAMTSGDGDECDCDGDGDVDGD